MFFGGETKEHRENPHMLRENMQTSLWKFPGLDVILWPFHWEGQLYQVHHCATI